MSYNSPVNIDLNGAYPPCTDTCNFAFTYSDSKCVVRKQTFTNFQNLYVPYESGNSSTTVTYQGIQYTPTAVIIFNSSFHTYDKAKSTGELLITHSGIGGTGAGKTLIVSIPILVSDSTLSASGAIIDAVIKAVPRSEVPLTAEQSASTYNVNFTNGTSLFNLSDISPSNNPFYTYIGNSPYSTASEAIHYIVFPQESACRISAGAVTNLKAIVKPIVPPTSSMPANGVSKNNLGANARKSGELYIECNPTGADGVILYKKSLTGSAATSGMDDALSTPSSSIFESSPFIIIIFIILTLLCVGVFIVVLKYIMEQISKKNDTATATATAT